MVEVDLRSLLYFVAASYGNQARTAGAVVHNAKLPKVTTRNGRMMCVCAPTNFIYFRSGFPFVVSRSVPLAFFVTMTTLAYVIIIAVGVVLFFLLFWSEVLPGWLVTALGVVAPSVCLVVGFFPQFAEVFRLRNSSGLSPGLCLLDIMACSMALVVLLHGKVEAGAEDSSGGNKAMSIWPYASILVCSRSVLVGTERWVITVLPSVCLTYFPLSYVFGKVSSHRVSLVEASGRF